MQGICLSSVLWVKCWPRILFYYKAELSHCKIVPKLGLVAVNWYPLKDNVKQSYLNVNCASFPSCRKKKYLSFQDNSACYLESIQQLAAKLHKSHNPTSAKIQNTGCRPKSLRDSTQYILYMKTLWKSEKQHTHTVHVLLVLHFSHCFTQERNQFPVIPITSHGHHNKKELEAFSEAFNNSACFHLSRQ